MSCIVDYNDFDLVWQMSNQQDCCSNIDRVVGQYIHNIVFALGVKNIGVPDIRFLPYVALKT